MELNKLSDIELIELCLYQEKITEYALPELLSLTHVSTFFTTDNEGKSITKTTPQMELIGYYITPINEMEKEMNARNILKTYRSSRPLPDYQNCRFLIYDSYMDRLSHLFFLFEKGLLVKDNIDKVCKALTEQCTNHTMMS